MLKAIPVEQQLLLAASESDLTAIVSIVNGLSTREKEAVSTDVFDTVLDSIVRYAEIDRTESAYATMVFIRSVGRYASSAAINAMLLKPSSPASSLPVVRRTRADKLVQLYARAE